jgi:hypothetical protein
MIGKVTLEDFFGSSSKIYTKKTRRKLNKRFQENPALKIKQKKKNIGRNRHFRFSWRQRFSRVFLMKYSTCGKTGVSITIAEGDAKVNNVYEYDGKLPEFVTGRGGTNMNPFVTYFNKNREYNSLIILTDGFIPEKVS